MENSNNINPTVISVVMSVYNEPLSWIQEATESILHQTFEKFEYIIVIDNPKRDDVVEYLRNLNENRIKYIVNPENIGLVESLNKAILLSNGDFIARMDADDISEPKRLELELNYLSRNQLDLVGSNVNRIDTDGNLVGYILCPEKNEQIYKSIRHLGGIPHPTWLVKKSLYKSLNYYRAVDKAEDYDLLVRCVLGGYKLGCIQETLLNYRKNPNGISKSGKGQQRYMSYLLNRQLRQKKVMSEYELMNQMTKAEDTIRIWENYYNYSAYWGDILRKKRRISLKNIPQFDIRYLMVVFMNLKAKLL